MRAGQEGHEEEVGGGGKKAAEAAERVGGQEKGKRFADVQKRAWTERTWEEGREGGRDRRKG